jgi:hypothetical protein
MVTTALDDDKQEIRKYLEGEQSGRYVQLEFAFKYIGNNVKYKRPVIIYYCFSLYENGTIVKQLKNMVVNIYIW